MKQLGGFLSLCMIVFGIVGCCGLSSDASIIKSTNWANWEGDDVKVYTNLEGNSTHSTACTADACAALRVDTADGGYSVSKWDDIDIDAFCAATASLGRTGDCRLHDCKDSATGLQTSQILTTVTSLLALNLCFKRGEF